MSGIEHNLKIIQKKMLQAAQKSGRAFDAITLLLVSKAQPASAIQAAYQAGATQFGENYWQEAKEKIAALQSLPLCWHFIGPIQSNNFKYIAKHFSWVHSVCRDDIVSALSRYRPENLPKLKVCLQVNISGEETKSGISNHLDALLPLAQKVMSSPKLELCGLMGIAAPNLTHEAALKSFQNLNQLLKTLNEALGTSCQTLSMGMSQDFEAAIEAGSTCIRIGSSIFGGR